MGKTKLSVEKAIQVAKQCDSKITLQRNHSYTYKFLLKRPQAFIEATSHMVNPLKHKKSVIQAEANKYSLPYHFQLHSKWAYCCAQQNGWLDEVCAHMERRFIWDLASACLEAKKYDKRVFFRRKSRGAYNFLKKLGDDVLNDACSHMKKRFVWNHKLAIRIARKHTSRQSLRRANAGCMTYICDNNLTEKAFAHMTDVIDMAERKDFRIFEKELIKVLKKRKILYELIKEFKVMKGKNYRIDLVVNLKSLGKKVAVEFKADSSYWSKKEIEKQRKFYHSHLKKIGVKKTYLVSLKGKYGISSKVFLEHLIREMTS